MKVEDLRRDFDAIVLCAGATAARDLKVPGRELDGVHLAMTYLPVQNKLCLGDQIFEEQRIDAKGKGEVEYWAAIVKPGTILYELAGVSEEDARKTFARISHKLPVHCRFVTRRPTL